MVDVHSDVIRPAPWLAFRTYEHGSEWRSIILNELDHELVTLDGPSAAVWGEVERGLRPSEYREVAAKHGLTTEELDDFINTLRDAGLLRRVDSPLPNVAKPAPVTKRLEFAGNTDDELAMMSWVTDHGFLYSVQWEVTFRCNESCVHCYNPGAAHSSEERSDRQREELTTAEVRHMLDELARCGVFRLILSGGEVTLRRDFFEIVEYARSLGFAVAIYTNGLTATDAFVDRLSRLWPTSVSISVYSTTASVHDGITRVPGSFDRSIAALRRFHERGIKTYLKSTQMAHTVNGFELVRELAESLGAGPELDMHFSDGADGAKLAGALAVDDPATLVAMSMTPESPLFVGDAATDFGYFKKDRDATVCGSGISFMYLDPEGNFSPCSSMPIGSVNVRDGGLEAHWRTTPIGRNGPWAPPRSRVEIAAQSSDVENAPRGSLAWWQQIRLRDYRECGTHRRCGWCTKCPGLAHLEYGDVLGPSTVNCRNAGARMIAADLLRAEIPLSRVLAMGDAPFGRSATPRRLPLVTTQPHSERSVACGTGACGSFEGTARDRPLSHYESRYPGLELGAGPVEIVNALSRLDRFIQDFEGLLPPEPMDVMRPPIGKSRSLAHSHEVEQ